MRWYSLSMSNSPRRLAALSLLVGVAGLTLAAVFAATPSEVSSKPAAQVDRSPVDLILTADEKYLVTVNQTSSSLSLVDVATGEVIDEIS